MIRVVRWFEKYCPHPPHPLKRIEVKPTDAAALGIRRLMGLAFRSFPIQPSLLVPSILLATFYMWIQYYYMIPTPFAPLWLIDVYYWPVTEYYWLGLVSIAASILASWFLMRKAAGVALLESVRPTWSLGQFGGFMIASSVMMLLSVALNWIVWSLLVCSSPIGLLLNSWGIGWDTPFGMISGTLDNNLFCGSLYYYSPWFAAPDLLAMGVSRGLVIGSAIILAPVQVFYFLTMAGIFTGTKTIKRSILEAVHIVRSGKKQFALLSAFTALIAIPFESGLPIINDLTLGWAPRTYLWWHNWSLSILMLQTFKALSETIIGPAIVYYLRAFLAPILILMVFYFHRAVTKTST